MTAIASTDRAPRFARVRRGAGLMLLASAAVLTWLVLPQDLRGLLLRTLESIRAAGPLGAMIFILLYIAAAVLMLPASILTLSAGYLYGVAGGTAAVSVGSTLGASCAFLLGRYLARARIEKWLVTWPRLRALDAAVGGSGFKIVLLTRLSPLFPFNVVNYAFGLTRVPFRSYLIASWLGMLPVTILYVWIGAAVGDLTRIGSAPSSPGLGYLRWAGLAVTLAVTFMITRIARKALKAQVEPLSTTGELNE